MGQKTTLTATHIRLLVFLTDHNESKFSFTELKSLFSSGSTLSRALKFLVEKDFIKKTKVQINGKPYILYEISGWANDFGFTLKQFVK